MLRRGSLTELSAELERQKKNSKDIVVASEMVSAVPMADGIDLKFDSESYPLTRYAHQQLSEKMGIPWKYYERMENEKRWDLLSRNVNEWMRTKERRMLRILDDGNGPHVRAILSDKYRPIDNYDLLYSFLNALTPYKDSGKSIDVFQADVSETHMYVRARLPDDLYEVVKDDRVHPMIMLTNSEVGAGRMAVSLGMWRLICENGMWHEDIVKRVHLGVKLEIGIVEWSRDTLRKNDEALFAQVQDTVLTALEPERFTKFLEIAQKAAQAQLTGDVVQIIEQVGSNFTEVEQHKLIEMFAQEIATPAGKTQWGFANAVTRLAGQTEDADRQAELEILGGELLTTPIVVKVEA